MRYLKDCYIEELAKDLLRMENDAKKTAGEEALAYLTDRDPAHETAARNAEGKAMSYLTARLMLESCYNNHAETSTCTCRELTKR